MKQHILLEKAKKYNLPDEIQYPSGYTFSDTNGYWKNKLTGEALMLSSDPIRPQSKKEDVETGEDQKGE